MNIFEAVGEGKFSSFPKYDRENLNCGIAHLGVGGFHRAHQAMYLHHYLNKFSEDWMIYGVGPIESDKKLSDALNGQDCLYSLIESSNKAEEIHAIGSIKQSSVVPFSLNKILYDLSGDSIKIISLTITEKGYCYNIDKDLDLNHPWVVSDLKSEETIKTMIGLLYKVCELRLSENSPAITIQSCDNLPSNGDITKKLLLQFADLKDRSVCSWIKDNVTFPNSMVDRITPAPDTATVSYLKDKYGIIDQAALLCETYKQWVIEDNFINTRPRLEEVGVQFVKDVEPYEKLKVRMLNGTASAFAYISYLLNHDTVDSALIDSRVENFIRAYFEEVQRSVPQIQGVDFNAYKDSLIERWSNQSINDKIQRLALDGSQKVANAITPVVRYLLDNNLAFDHLSFSVAAWFRYLRGTDERGNSIDIEDPMASTLIQIAKNRDVGSFLKLNEIFGDTALKWPIFIESVQEYFDIIDQNGIENALEFLFTRTKQ